MTTIHTQEIIKILSDNSYSKYETYEAFVGLRARYDEPWRHHHNFEHPREMFEELLYHKHLAASLGNLAWAIMYHDAVYDPTANPGRNEELSAQLASHELPAIAGDATAKTVAHYTRETASHSDALNDSDLDLFLDIDLAVLGYNPKRYNQYARDIRAEYAHVPSHDYTLGRIAILTSLASRTASSGLYKTPEFTELYEDQAQENIAREIEHLRNSI